MADAPQNVVLETAVADTIESFTALDASGDKRSMDKLARRLGKEQPALLQFAAAVGEPHGEASVFYGTLVWAMFERQFGKQLPRLTPGNLTDAKDIVAEEHGKVDGLAERPAVERVAEALSTRQPHVYAKLVELLAEDVKESAITEDTAAAIFPPAQAIVEAFDAALDGRRPGERIGPIVREQPKVGRNEPCPCGSGKKYKRCCGAA